VTVTVFGEYIVRVRVTTGGRSLSGDNILRSWNLGPGTQVSGGRRTTRSRRRWTRSDKPAVEEIEDRFGTILRLGPQQRRDDPADDTESQLQMRGAGIRTTGDSDPQEACGSWASGTQHRHSGLWRSCARLLCEKPAVGSFVSHNSHRDIQSWVLTAYTLPRCP